MDKRNFIKNLEQNSENITLPEKLKKENILASLEDAPQITVVRPEKYDRQKRNRIISGIISVAASVAVIFGIFAVPGKPAPAPGPEPTADNTGGYSLINTVAAKYYMDNIYTEPHWYDTLAGTFSFGSVKYASDTAVNENAGLQNVTSQVSDYGKTNVQVEGTDEADIIKNDGRYLYVLSDNKLYIANKDLDTLSETDLTAGLKKDEYITSSEIFISGDKLTVITGTMAEYRYTNGRERYIVDYAYPQNAKTQIAVYDISDRTAPKTEYSYSVDGHYITSRMFNGKILTVTQYDIPYGSVNCKTQEEAETALADVCIPSEYKNGTENKIPSGNISIPDTKTPVSYITCTMFYVDDAENTVNTNALLGNGENVYCSDEYMFVSGYKYSAWQNGKEIYALSENGINYNSATNIYMYSVKGDSAEFIADGTVPGNTIGQYSVDYYNGYFRIGVNYCIYAENGNYAENANRIYILDSKLDIVGKTEPFGKDENLRSVRFSGNTAYAVTFLQTDPLFVFDLTNPQKPEICGEVKLPGFSEYLHPVQNGMLVGVGYGGTLDGLDNSAKLSLFDASDMKHPKEIDSLIIPDSCFNTNPKGFAILQKGLYGLIYSSYNEYCYNMISFAVFGTDNGKINVKYTVCPDYCKNNSDIWEGNCRLTYIGNVLYFITGDRISSYNISTGKEIKNIIL